MVSPLWCHIPTVSDTLYVVSDTFYEDTLYETFSSSQDPPGFGNGYILDLCLSII